METGYTLTVILHGQVLNFKTCTAQLTADTSRFLQSNLIQTNHEISKDLYIYGFPVVVRDGFSMRLRGGGTSGIGHSDRHVPKLGAAGLIEKIRILQRSVEANRLELCPWEQFGIECEEAFAYQQVGLVPD